MLKKIAIGFGVLVLIAVTVIYGNYFFWKAIEDRDAVKNVNEQHAIADIEGDRNFPPPGFEMDAVSLNSSDTFRSGLDHL